MTRRSKTTARPTATPIIGRQCNRCSAATDGRGCPRCGCPEFRLVRDPQRRLFTK